MVAASAKSCSPVNLRFPSMLTSRRRRSVFPMVSPFPFLGVYRAESVPPSVHAARRPTLRIPQRARKTLGAV